LKLNIDANWIEYCFFGEPNCTSTYVRTAPPAPRTPKKKRRKEHNNQQSNCNKTKKAACPQNEDKLQLNIKQQHMHASRTTKRHANLASALVRRIRQFNNPDGQANTMPKTYLSQESKKRESKCTEWKCYRGDNNPLHL